MRRGVLRIRLEVVQTVSEAGAFPGREAGFDVPLLWVPEGHAEVDIHVERGRVPQLRGQKEDQGEDTVQFRGFGADRAGQGL